MTVRTKQFRVGLIAALIITLHIGLCLYVSFVPYHALPRKKILAVYRQLVVLGPFFTESRINYSHHFSVRYKRHNGWSSARQFGKEHFEHYRNNPIRWDKLAYIGYENQLTFDLGAFAKGSPFETVQKSSAFRELNEFVMQELIKESVDSVQLIYGLNYFYPESKSSRMDTVFAYTYNPNVIGKAKR